MTARHIPGLRATEVFDTYWTFAANDEILSTYRFTNAYRAADRVSQYLIKEVLYSGKQTTEEIVFRCLLFRLFNRIETWELLKRTVGQPEWRRWRRADYARQLDRALREGGTLYTAAYIMPSPSLGSARKHRNHLRLLEMMMTGGIALRLDRARSLQEVFHLLRAFPSIGEFLAFIWMGLLLNT